MAPRENARFVTLAFLVLLDSLGGTQYIYGQFSAALKDTFHLKQDVIDYGALAQNVGNNVGIHASLLLEAHGPRPLILLAGLVGFVSYALLFASFQFEWPLGEQVWLFYFIMALQGQAQMFADMIVVPLAVRRFPENAGMALGLCKSFLGLSGSMVVLAYKSFFAPDTIPFMMFLALLFPAVCLLAFFFVSVGHELEGPRSAKRSAARETAAKAAIGRSMLFVPVLLALLVSGTFIGAHGAKVAIVFSVVAVLAAMLSFLSSRPDYAWDAAQDAAEFAPLLETAGESSSSSSSSSRSSSSSSVGAAAGATPAAGAPPSPSPSPTTFSMGSVVRGAAFWLQVLCVISAWGSGLLLINNVGQLVQVVGLSKASKDTFVSVISIFNCVGRIAAGVLSDALVRRGVKRVFVFGFLVLGMGLGMLVLSLATPTALGVAAAMVGFLYGACNVLNPAILGDLYGQANVSRLYSSVILSVIGGCFLIATRLFAAVYQAHATLDPQGSDTCTGAACIELSSRICAALCVTVGSGYLAFHSRRAHVAT